VDIIIATSDEDHVNLEEIKEAVEKLGYLVLSVRFDE
jgi:copper chaperone CopZ